MVVVRAQFSEMVCRNKIDERGKHNRERAKTWTHKWKFFFSLQRRANGKLRSVWWRKSSVNEIIWYELNELVGRVFATVLRVCVCVFASAARWMWKAAFYDNTIAKTVEWDGKSLAKVFHARIIVFWKCTERERGTHAHAVLFWYMEEPDERITFSGYSISVMTFPLVLVFNMFSNTCLLNFGLWCVCVGIWRIHYECGRNWESDLVSLKRNC